MEEKLITHIELAQRWGINRQAVTNRAARQADFPKPVYRSGNRGDKLYRLEDIEKYESIRGKKGREYTKKDK